MSRRRLLLFTKPARPGRVKTRLIGDLTPQEAADLHAAFLADLLDRLSPRVPADFELLLAWALEPGEEAPASTFPAIVQQGADLGERLHLALAEAARDGAVAAAVGSDHPTLPAGAVLRAFEAVEAIESGESGAKGAGVALGPAEDGGYYLIALAPRAVVPGLFAGIPWSTGGVLAETLSRCRGLGLSVELLPPAWDVDTPADLARLAALLADGDYGCPRTRSLLAGWGRLERPARAAGVPSGSIAPGAPSAPGALDVAAGFNAPGLADGLVAFRPGPEAARDVRREQREPPVRAGG